MKDVALYHKAKKTKAEILEMIEKREWPNFRSIWGYANWAFFYIIIGARAVGKSYLAMDFALHRFFRKGAPFYWLRLTEPSVKALLGNNGLKFVDADLARKYKLNLKKKGDDIFHNGRKMATILALSTSANDKGVALFDKDYNKGYTIIIDEFQYEPDQRRTFDLVKGLKIQLENIVRTQKKDIKIIFMGNTCEDASDVLTMFNFIPEKFGIFKLKSQKCVVVNMKPTEAFMKRRKGSVLDILEKGQGANITNKLPVDTSLIYKGRLTRPSLVIKFSKLQSDWFTVWDQNVVAPYNGENKRAFAMRRYIDEHFDPKIRDQIFELADVRAFRYRNLITQRVFYNQLALIKTA